MGRRRMMRRYAKASPAVRWVKDSYQAKVGIVILIIFLMSAFIYSSAENVPIYEGLFVSLILLFGESADPVTSVGKVSVILTMITGLIFFALIIGEVSGYLIERIMRRGKVKVLKYYSGKGHIIICGMSDKLKGIITELRSEDLETIHPILILSPNSGNISFGNDDLKRQVFAMVGDPLDNEMLERANLVEARSILVLSTDETIQGEEKYRDAYVALVYNTIYNFLSKSEKSGGSTEDMNFVLEFVDDGMNLLPCARGEGHHPEIYTSLIPGTARRLIVEPIYQEDMPRYLFIQSVLEPDVNTMVNELLSTSLNDTCEFYYHNVTGNLLGKTFNSIETSLLATGVTAIGILRHSQAMVDMAISGYEEANRVELHLNPESEMILTKDDVLVLISYDEREVTAAFAEINPGKFVMPQQIASKPNACKPLSFKRIVLINWNRQLIRDLVTEIAKLCANITGAKGTHEKLEIVLLNDLPSGSPEITGLIKQVSDSTGRPLEELISLKTINLSGPMSIKKFKDAGITRENARDTRVLIVSENGADKDSDLQTLHQLQIIENRIWENIFTAVELIDSKSQHYFKNTKANVIVSIDSFAEHLMAQAVLKPYISLIFRDLLTFSDEDCEFYFRDVPDSYVGKTYGELQKALVGHPLILIGHARPIQDQKRLHTRYSVTLNPKIAGQYDDSGREPRILKTEKLRKGDRAILVARLPEVVDSVLGSIK